MTRFLFSVIFSILLSNNCPGQTNTENSYHLDSTLIQKDTIKSFSIGGTPILAFDADLGFRYGVVVNLFDYGKDEDNVYPNYLQYAYIKAFNTTKGTSSVSVLYDNLKISPKLKLNIEATFMKDIALSFFGFNGLQSKINHEFNSMGKELKLNRFFHTHERSLLRFKIDGQRTLWTPNIRGYLGLSFSKILIGDTDFSKFEVELTNNESNAIESTLFETYKKWGLLKEEDINGGNILYFTPGFVYDSRNNLINCTNGIFFETYLIQSIGLGKTDSFSKHIFSFRHYLHNHKKEFTFSYRVSSQQKLGGEIPFYLLPTYFDAKINQDGVGGAFNMRGVFRNRIAANGFINLNAELRKKVYSFNLLKQKFNVEISVFSDVSQITQEYDVDIEKIPIMYKDLFVNEQYNKTNIGTGLGLYIIYNTNNILSFNYGFSHNKDLGSGGLYVGSSFLF